MCPKTAVNHCETAASSISKFLGDLTAIPKLNRGLPHTHFPFTCFCSTVVIMRLSGMPRVAGSIPAQNIFLCDVVMEVLGLGVTCPVSQNTRKS